MPPTRVLLLAIVFLCTVTSPRRAMPEKVFEMNEYWVSGSSVST